MTEARTTIITGNCSSSSTNPATSGSRLPASLFRRRWANGERIQSYSNVHHDGYEDYSHGARLVSQQITVDGQSMRLEDALADPALRSLFTNQSGAFRY